MANIFRGDEWVRTTGGQAVQGAHVYWLTQPVTVPSFEPVGGPPNQAAVFTDSTGLTPASQPLITDGFGHVDTYLGTGFYTVAVYLNGNLVQQFADQTIGGTGVLLINSLGGAVNLVAGSNTQVQVINQTIQISGVSGFPLPAATAVGDILRWNILSDNKWEPFNYNNMYFGLAVSGATLVNVGTDLGTGSPTGGVGANGTATQIFPTINSPNGLLLTGSGSATTSSQVGVVGSNNGNNGLSGFGCNQRLTIKVGVTLNPNCRYWMGFGTQINGSGIFPTGSTYCTDAPNNNTIGFRFSPGTDTHWQAYIATTNVLFTAVDTGVAPVNATPQIFDIVANALSTSFAFYINRVLVATITTNIPSFTGGFASNSVMFVTGDNKNTANQPILSFYYALVSLKGQTPGV